MGFHAGSVGENPPTMQELQEMRAGSLDWADPMEEGMAPQSSILVRNIPQTEESGGLQSTG